MRPTSCFEHCFTNEEEKQTLDQIHKTHLRPIFRLHFVPRKMTDYSHTSYTLLQRAHDTEDEDAWNRFVGHYRRFIVYVLRQLGVTENDIDDLAQQILIGLTNDLPSYDRTRSSFRTWLGAVIRNAAFSHFRKLKCRPVDTHGLWKTLPEKTFDQPTEIDRWIETEWETYISNKAMEQVRKVFTGNAINVFELGLDGHSAAEIAERTGLSIASVYTLRKRVKKRLYIEVRALTAELEG